MRVVISVKNYRSEDFTYTLGSQGHWAYVLSLQRLALPMILANIHLIRSKLTLPSFRYVVVVVGIICGCIPVLPGFFRHLVPTVTQKLSCHCSKFRDLFSRFIFPSRITRSFTAPYRDSEGDSSCGRDEKGQEFPDRLSQFDCP